MVMMQTKEIKPFVRFEVREYGLDDQASKEAGRPVPRMVTFILITAHGSKDEAAQVVEEWLPRKRREAEQGLYNPEWVEYFEKAYAAWQKGHELPREGTPILTWQMVKPEQNARLRALGITTVEDLSAIPDAALGEIGLDARHLRDTARAWINEGQQKGINAQELANAQQQLRDQAAVIEELRQRLAALEDEKPKKRQKEAA